MTFKEYVEKINEAYEKFPNLRNLPAKAVLYLADDEYEETAEGYIIEICKDCLFQVNDDAKGNDYVMIN